MKDNNSSYNNVSCVHISKEAQECNATTVNIVLPPAVSPKLRISEVFPNGYEFELVTVVLALDHYNHHAKFL